MKAQASLAVGLGVAVCLSATALFTQERQIGGVGLTVFTDRNFRGRSATIRDDMPNLQAIGLNDAVSSLQVGPGEQWEVCEHANYEGRCVVVSGSEFDLRPSKWNRRFPPRVDSAAAPPCVRQRVQDLHRRPVGTSCSSTNRTFEGIPGITPRRSRASRAVCRA
jgi:hypothetical protein